MVEGGNQWKSECLQIICHAVSAAHGPPCSQSEQPELSLLSGQQRAGPHVLLPLALFPSSHESHHLVLGDTDIGCPVGTGRWDRADMPARAMSKSALP